MGAAWSSPLGEESRERLNKENKENVSIYEAKRRGRERDENPS